MAGTALSSPKLLWERIVGMIAEWRALHWKKKAVKQSLAARNLRKKVKRIGEQRDAIAAERDLLISEVAALKKSLGITS